MTQVLTTALHAIVAVLDFLFAPDPVAELVEAQKNKARLLGIAVR